MDDWGWQQLRPWLSHRTSLPPGPLFCVIYGTRGRPWDVSAAGMWPDPGENDANTAWVRGFYDATAPHSEAGGYVNFMADDDQERIKDNYKGNYDRLVDVKRAYDPDNLFRHNQNISP
jgi:hypothetical protein